ncbi:immunity protein TriTu family protein [Bradyrhizobium brasilense]|uniref:Uncharacterized protein n=1 Tax=Bradyrhizobium brasilense TaxID=1419277 RepID=A0ABY8JLZ5_9BRAD|nr:hypothetical protein [Bradyrhizobium brasilense]WFU66680.1 hypothetical protein QA636_14705 [Bradyrhizobium brasilense]
MLNNFIDWAQQIADRPLGNGVKARVTESEVSDNPSARLDIDAPTTVARITCWGNGDYNTEVIDLETEQTLFSNHGTLQEGKPFSEQFAAFFKSLGVATA